MKKIVLTAALALVALFAVVSSASAFNAAVSPGGAITTASSGKVTFRAGEISITCNLSLSGSLNTSVTGIETPSGQSLGSISGVSWRECTGGEVSAVLGLNWNILYTGETGTLPSSVSSIGFTIQNAQFRLSVFGGFVNCLYAGEAPVTMSVLRTRTANQYTTSTIRTNESSFAKVSGSLCPNSGSMTGTFSMSPTQTITVS